MKFIYENDIVENVIIVHIKSDVSFYDTPGNDNIITVMLNYDWRQAEEAMEIYLMFNVGFSYNIYDNIGRHIGCYKLLVKSIDESNNTIKLTMEN